MRMFASLCILLFFSLNAQADVGIHGSIVKTDSNVGVKFLGEIKNDTDSSIGDVKISITSKDNTDTVIDVAEGYVDGYNDPENTLLNAYVPAGAVVPFSFYGDVKVADIASYSYTISYVEREGGSDIPDDVFIAVDMNLVESLLGATFNGEVTNHASTCVYNTKITFAIRDHDGNMISVEKTFVEGENFLHKSGVYVNTLVSPEETVPFKCMTLIDPSIIGSYYAIITHEYADFDEYHYFGEDSVYLHGELGTEEFLGDVNYLGEIRNTTNHDIYFAEISVITRNSDGAIIDISNSYVNGTSYEYRDGLTTDTHIAPGETASFEVYSSAAFDEAASNEYRIYYRYAETPSAVEEAKPPAFMLQGNYPNPFNPTTTISFALQKQTQIELSVYNATGQKLETLVDARLVSGNHSVDWNAAGYPSGVYFYKLESSTARMSGKMLLLK